MQMVISDAISLHIYQADRLPESMDLTARKFCE